MSTPEDREADAREDRYLDDQEAHAPIASPSTAPPLLLDVTAAARAYLTHEHREAGRVWAALIGAKPTDLAKLREVAVAAIEHGSMLGYIPPC